LDRLKVDRLKIDDPSCSQYQIVIDLMAKDEGTLEKEKLEKLEKLRQEQS